MTERQIHELLIATTKIDARLAAVQERLEDVQDRLEDVERLTEAIHALDLRLTTVEGSTSRSTSFFDRIGSAWVKLIVGLAVAYAMYKIGGH